MSTGLSLIRSPHYKNARDEGVARLLKILPGSDDGQVTPNWLLGTRKWDLIEEFRGDLLTVFIEQVEELAEQGALKRDATYERAISFVEELRERREALINSE